MLNLPKDVLARHPEWGVLPPVDAPQAFQNSMPMNWFANQAMENPGIRPDAHWDMIGSKDYLQQVNPDGNPNTPNQQFGGGMPLPNYNPRNIQQQGFGPGTSPIYDRNDGSLAPMPFAQGGVVNIGNVQDPNQYQGVTYNPALNGEGNLSYTGQSQPQPQPQPQPQVMNQTQALPAPAQQGTPYQLPGSAGGPIANTWQANQNALAAGASYIQAQQNVLGALPQKRAADANVLNAQDADVTANRAYLNEQLRASQAAMQAEQKIQAAKANTGDQIAVAQEQNLRNNGKYKYQLAGMSIPVEINLPPDFNGRLPPGVQQKLQTLSEILTDKENDADKMRQFQVEAARIHAANTGLDVKVADIARGRVSLTIDELEAAARAAGLTSQAADLQVQAAQQPPSPGLVWNQVKNKWTSSEEANYDMKQYTDDFANAQSGYWGNVPMGTLSQWAVSGTINDAQYREALISQGIAPTLADKYVAQAAYDRQQRESGNNAMASEIARLLGLDANGGNNGNNAAKPPVTQQIPVPNFPQIW